MLVSGGSLYGKGLFTPSDHATVTVMLTGGAFEDQRCRPSTLR